MKKFIEHLQLVIVVIYKVESSISQRTKYPLSSY
jgi:hypothetical protein